MVDGIRNMYKKTKHDRYPILQMEEFISTFLRVASSTNRDNNNKGQDAFGQATSVMRRAMLNGFPVC